MKKKPVVANFAEENDKIRKALQYVDANALHYLETVKGSAICEGSERLHSTALL